MEYIHGGCVGSFYGRQKKPAYFTGDTLTLLPVRYVTAKQQTAISLTKTRSGTCQSLKVITEELFILIPSPTSGPSLSLGRGGKKEQNV